MPAIPVVAVPIEDATWYVDASATTAGAGSAQDPFRSIGSALDVAEAGDSIEVAPGTYGAYETFPLQISGGWIDIYSTDGAADTIIDADGAVGPVVYAEGAGFSFSGFTLTGAVSPELDLEMEVGGGGMAILDCGADLSDLVITDNLAPDGAGLFISNSEVYIDDSIIADNGSHSTELGVDITAKLPIGDGTRYGGGISVHSSYLEMDGCEITGNMADRRGAGIECYYSELEVYDSLIADNVLADDSELAVGSMGPWSGEVLTQDVGLDDFDGAGVSGYESHLDFENTEFSGNVGTYGAVAADYCELLLINSTVTDHEGFAAVGYSAPADMEYFSAQASGHDRELPQDSVHTSTIRDVADGSVEIQGGMEIEPYTAIVSTLFTSNTAETVVMGYGGITQMLNSLFVDNDIMFPTIALENAYADIDFCTLARNGSAWGLWTVGPYADVWAWGSIIWDGEDDDSDVRLKEYSPSVMWSGDLGLFYDDLKSEPQYLGDDLEPNAGYDEMGVIYEDPRFMDAAAGDYRLAMGSPCVDSAGDEGPDFDFAGNYRPQDGDEDGEALFDMGALEHIAGGTLSGTDRYKTAIQVVEQNFEFADTVVIATGERFPDGLTASALCGVYDAPLLLTPSDELLPEVVAEIERLGAWNVFIVGGNSTVSPAVEDALEALDMDVTRIGGADRYETAALIAEHVIDNTEFDGMVFLARGDRFADALAVAPVAYANQTPILLVRSTRLPADVVEVLYDYDISSATVLGGDAAVSTMVEAGIQMSLGITTERIGGEDRYETAALISEWAYDNGMADFGTVGLATGTDFPDALCGGPGIGARGGVLLLTAPDGLSEPTGDAFAGHSGEVSAVQFFGGATTLSGSVKTEVYGLLGW